MIEAVAMLANKEGVMFYQKLRRKFKVSATNMSINRATHFKSINMTSAKSNCQLHSCKTRRSRKSSHINMQRSHSTNGLQAYEMSVLGVSL